MPSRGSPLAEIAKADGDSEAAQTKYASAEQMLERTLGADHPYRASALAGLGSLQRQRGQLRRALDSLREAVRFQTLDPSGIANVDLLWSDGERTHRLRCGRTSPAVSCKRSGREYEFRFWPGAGRRYFSVSVEDGAGNRIVSPLGS